MTRKLASFLTFSLLRVLMGMRVCPGFGETKHAVDPGIVMQDASYFKTEGVFDADWRSGDSIWALATPDELEAALGKARELAETGELQWFMKQHDAPRSEVGQLTFSSAQKI